jgi:type VI secretion system protein ImpH
MTRSRDKHRDPLRPRSCLEELKSEPFRFQFFQAVRLLELADPINNPICGDQHVNPVGYDFLPRSEVVRFHAAPTQSFPGCEILSLNLAETGAEDDGRSRPPGMVVSFLGLTGPSGVLPQHYTQRLIDELRLDLGLRDFFDLFNHRLISLFYRVWKKHRLPISYETESFAKKSLRGRPVDERDEGDLYTFALYSLIGMGTLGLRGRQLIPDEGLLFYAGQFAQLAPKAISLEQMLVHYFGYSVSIVQFIGQWLKLSPSEQSKLSSDPEGLGNNALGQTSVAGERVWSIENKFCVRIGPLEYSQFWGLLPGVRHLEPLGQFVRTYVGTSYDFEVQLVLKKEEVPGCRIGGEGMSGSYLGWNTWVLNRPLQEDADDVVLQITYP